MGKYRMHNGSYTNVNTFSKLEKFLSNIPNLPDYSMLKSHHTIFSPLKYETKIY